MTPNRRMTRYEQLSMMTQEQAAASATLDFCKYLQCRATVDNNDWEARQLFVQQFPQSLHLDVVAKSLDGFHEKAAVTPGSPTTGWAAPLAGLNVLTSAFTAATRAASLLGRIPGLTRVPFGVAVPIATSAGSFTWVAENTVKPMSALGFASVTLKPAKAAGLIAVQEELLITTRPGTDRILSKTLIGGLSNYLDKQFIDPTVAPVVGVHPGSITNGIAATPGTGILADDVSTLLGVFFSQHPAAISPTLLASPGVGVALAGLGHADVRVDGVGYVSGMPLVCSVACGSLLIVLDAADIVYADDGDIRVDISRQASLQLNDAPDSPPIASTVPTSLWQNNLLGVKVEQILNWQRAQPTSVQWLDTATP